MSVEEAARYSSRVVADYIAYGAGGDLERLSGKDVLEIGPGDNLGVALVLLAKGARTVTSVDGFTPNSDLHHNAKVYRAIYDTLTPEEQQRIRDVVTLQADGTAIVNGERLISCYAVPIDRDTTPFKTQSYDIVISRAVLEHLGNLHLGWTNMVRSLRPNGEMWHKVDFRCHEMFAQIHPLYFLTVPDVLWNFISRPDPTLNRLRLPTYRELAARDFNHSHCYITHIVDDQEFMPHVESLAHGTHYSERHSNLIRAIRPRLLKRFSEYSDPDLMVTGIFLALSGVRA